MNVTHDVAVGELRLLRSWQVDPLFGPELHSTYINHFWVPGENTAVCRPQSNNKWDSKHKAPEAGCHCGFYGVFNANSLPAGSVMGVAEYWGRVRMGARGIRAEHARVVAICPWHVHRRWYAPGLLAGVGEVYNAEVYDSTDSLLDVHFGRLTKPSEFDVGHNLDAEEPYHSGFGIGD